jgi:hypothetical protein
MSWFLDAINIADKSGAVIVQTDDSRKWLGKENNHPCG